MTEFSFDSRGLMGRSGHDAPDDGPEPPEVEIPDYAQLEAALKLSISALREIEQCAIVLDDNLGKKLCAMLDDTLGAVGDEAVGAIDGICEIVGSDYLDWLEGEA